MQDLTSDELSDELRKNFIIKVVGHNYFIGNALNTAIRYKGLIELIGDEELVNRICIKALESGNDTYAAKLRRGLTIKFISF